MTNVHGTTDARRVVIVGAGAGGCTVAATLKRQGFDGTVTILDEDPDAPYDRPPLSKTVLVADAPELSQVRLPLHPDVKLEGGVSVTGCDVIARSVTTSDGRVIPYDELVIASGVAARSLPHLPDRNVYTLRTWADALALRAALHQGGSLVVIGAGFLGLELAATARSLGLAVTVVAAEEAPLESRLGAVVAARLVREHRARGVNLLTGQSVSAIREASSNHDRVQVRLGTGEVIESDVVAVAIGSQPLTGWIDSSVVDAHGGVRCDHRGQAAEGVWAVGDVARWYSTTDGTWSRHEHRTSAMEQAMAVAHAILDKEPPKRRAPFFWTDQFEIKIQVWGEIPRHPHTTVLAGDPDGGSFVLALSPAPDTEPAAVLAWNATKDALKHRVALDERFAGQVAGVS